MVGETAKHMIYPCEISHLVISISRWVEAGDFAIVISISRLVKAGDLAVVSYGYPGTIA